MYLDHKPARGSLRSHHGLMWPDGMLVKRGDPHVCGTCGDPVDLDDYEVTQR